MNHKFLRSITCLLVTWMLAFNFCSLTQADVINNLEDVKSYRSDVDKFLYQACEQSVYVDE